jgi:hypothetical protein
MDLVNVRSLGLSKTTLLAAKTGVSVPVTSAISFYNLVGAADQRGREGDAQGVGCLHFDEQLDLRDQLDRQIRRLLAIEYGARRARAPR